jgi:DNA mismatch repair protein MSH2
VHFTTPQLERLADRYKAIDAEYQSQQQGLVSKAVETASTYLPVVEAASTVIAELDVLTSFATAAALSPNGYVRPVLRPRGSGVLKLSAARHPCVELMDGVNFIANDYDLERGSSNYQIITGPNMGGKSTYIRGIGCIAVMAQVGSFVPCDAAEISVLDSVLARVGAGDAVQKGVSTFMAEMLEASVILETASRDSLIIIDELGRGTSTFDGFGIAWAISEYVVSNIDCMCLFATHFHELTALAAQHPGVVNKHVAAYVEDEKGGKCGRGDVIMLYNVQDGPCTKSFGIHVANAARFPKEVIEEAKRKAAELEDIGHTHSHTTGHVGGNDEVSAEKRRRIDESMQRFSSRTEQSFAASADAGTLSTELRDIFAAPVPIAV